MATIRDHRVHLDVNLAPSLLSGEGLAELHSLHRVFIAATDELDKAEEALFEAKEAPALRDEEIRRAVRANKRPPAPLRHESREEVHQRLGGGYRTVYTLTPEAQERVKMATEARNAALAQAKTAAEEFEAAVRAARPHIRTALIPDYIAAHEAAAEAQRLAEEAASKRNILHSALRTLDDAVAVHAAAEAKRAGKFQVFVRALDDARRAAMAGAGELPAEVREDLLERDEYVDVTDPRKMARRRAQAEYDAHTSGPQGVEYLRCHGREAWDKKRSKLSAALKQIDSIHRGESPRNVFLSI